MNMKLVKRVFAGCAILLMSVGNVAFADAMCGPNGQFNPANNQCRFRILGAVVGSV